MSYVFKAISEAKKFAREQAKKDEEDWVIAYFRQEAISKVSGRYEWFDYIDKLC